MRLLTNKEVNRHLGKPSLWTSHTSSSGFKLTYMGGISCFDDLISRGKPHLMMLVNRPKGVEFVVMSGFKTPQAGIYHHQILSITIEDKQQIYEKKDKSMVGRALAGGLLLGPVGAIVGGMTALNNTKSIAMPELVCTLIYKSEDETEKAIVMSCKQKNKATVYKFLSTNFPDKFIIQ